MADIPHKPATKGDRVAYVASRMRAGTWVPGPSGRALAEAWGMEYSRVREDASEASRLVRAERPGQDERVDYASACATELLERAMAAARGPEVDPSKMTPEQLEALAHAKAGAIRTAATALAAYNRVHGTEAPRVAAPEPAEAGEKKTGMEGVWASLAAGAAKENKTDEN